MSDRKTNRSKVTICFRLIDLVKPLTGQMIMAVLLGTLGHISAILIPVLGVSALLGILKTDLRIGWRYLPAMLVGLAVFRGLFRYGEQYLNHFIAFKLLALLRDKVFTALRRLCPAKLEGRDRGDLIALITSDIELLEVFYAHTISPVCIAALVGILVAIAMATVHPLLAALCVVAHGTVGVVIPMVTTKRGGEEGIRFRAGAGDLSAFMLDSLRGLRETLQYANDERRLAEMRKKTNELREVERRMKEASASAAAVTQSAILLFDFLFLFVCAYLYYLGQIEFSGMLFCLILLMSSFGPFVSLANLGSGLQNTFAAAGRVLDILEEHPMTDEIHGKEPCVFEGAKVDRVRFSYGNELILDDVSAWFPQGEIVGILGKSGSGKSTLLKLLMRFWETEKGQIAISDRSIDTINTEDLRRMESYVTQTTHLFSDSIAQNLRIAKSDATQEELERACRKAAVHDFILKLPQGYDTPVGELGEKLSGGERQRIGLARSFLHDAPFLLLDEPTSNLDSLNEAIILKSVGEEKENRTVVIVSHRDSTMRLAERVYSVERGRMS